MAFERVVGDEEALRELIPKAPPTRLSRTKAIDHLDDHARAWVEASPFVIVGTAGPNGLDVSPRGGPPGWIRILDERRLALPDAPGNRRADTFRNVIADPRCGLIFLVPGRRETLRVNGRACATTDPAALEGIPGSPVIALGVDVEEVFLHCSKAFIRSNLWDPGAWPDPASLPSGACILRDHVAINGTELELADAEEQVARSVAERLW